MRLKRMHLLTRHSFLPGLLLCATFSAWGQLRVGGAKVDITPPAGMLPPPFRSIHDHVFTRAIYLANGTESALLMNVALGKFEQGFYDRLAAEITRRYGIPASNLVISAEHVHSNVPDLGLPVSGLDVGHMQAAQAYVEQVFQAMVQAAGTAKAASEPAEVGYGEGMLDLNVNRDAIDPKTRTWAREPNFEYPSDKTLAVIEFRRPNGGSPIALYVNYAMHAVTMFLRGQISGDFPEATSQYLEENADGALVALWTSGAAGDQNPVYRRAINALDDEQIEAEVDPTKTANAAEGEQNKAMMRLMFSGASRPVAPLDPKLEAQSWKVVQAIATLTGEETLRVMGGISFYQASAQIKGASGAISCPGRTRLDNVREGSASSYADGPATHIQFGALRIGDIAISRVNAEIYSRIGQEAKAGSPFRRTLIVTLANGKSDTNYIPTDDAFGRSTFEVLGSHLKPGCAESGIVSGIDVLLEQLIH